MPSFALTTSEIILIFITLVLVVLPSRLSQIGNLLGRLFKGPPREG